MTSWVPSCPGKVRIAMADIPIHKKASRSKGMSCSGDSDSMDRLIAVLPSKRRLLSWYCYDASCWLIAHTPPQKRRDDGTQNSSVKYLRQSRRLDCDPLKGGYTPGAAQGG